MTIAFLTASVSHNAGGLYDAVRRLAVEQAALNGSSILVFGLEDLGTFKDLAGWQGLPVQTAAVLGPRSFGYAPQLLRSLAAAQPDLLHQHGLWMYPSVACCRWSTRTRKPYIVSPHGMLDPWALGNSAWKKRLARWLYENRNLRGAACLHALCEAEACAIRAYGLKNPICVIPNGIDVPPSLQAPPPDWEDGGTRGAKVLLYLGRLHPKKNLLNLLHAWTAVQHGNKAVRDWRLVIAGWGQNGYQAQLERAASDLEIERAVRFPGPQFGDAKHATLCRADAFILPSLSEGLPMAVLEAWAYGLPVLMTPECNLPEGFQAEAAIAIQTEPQRIAEGLEALFGTSEAERREMGERGRRLVAERFSWPRIAAQMKSVYEWILRDGTKPDCVKTE
jgi:glycosyltransferase involved in cell wall biosynthesis